MSNDDLKLWHDDVRHPPEGWVWARSNTLAKTYLLGGNVSEISLDHDMGCEPEEGIYAKGDSEDDGTKLVNWMIEEQLVPDIVTIHSWNPIGARRMWNLLHDEGYEATIRPYEDPNG